MRHQQLAQVLTTEPGGQGVDAFVGQGHLAADERAGPLPHGRRGEPGDARSGLGHGAQRLVDGEEADVDAPVAVVEDLGAELAQAATTTQSPARLGVGD